MVTLACMVAAEEGDWPESLAEVEASLGAPLLDYGFLASRDSPPAHWIYRAPPSEDPNGTHAILFSPEEIDGKRLACYTDGSVTAFEKSNKP